MSSCAEGEYGAISGASSATSANATMVAAAVQKTTRARAARLPPASRPAPAPEDAGAWCSTGTKTGVDSGIEQIGEQAADGDHHAADDDASGDEVVVARGNGVRDEESHPGPREDLLHEERAASHGGQQQPEDRDHRQQSVAQGMAKDHRPLARAF